MVDHGRIWNAIDRLAAEESLSPSALARRAGLDPTAFNKSKRVGPDGRPRWPSTESIAKVLEATGRGFDAFAGLVAGAGGGRRTATVPLLGFAKAGTGGYFEDGGFPAGTGWDEIAFPADEAEGVYALEVEGDSMLPLYRDGDRLIVSPTAQARRDDRVVVKTTSGEVMAKILARRTARVVELRSLNPEHPDRVIPIDQIEWVARILWASQ